MNEFDELKKLFKPTKKFEDIIKCLTNKETVKTGKELIEKIECSEYLNYRDLLSIFLIDKHSKDTVGDITIESNKNLIEFVKKMLDCNYENNEEFKMDVIKYAYHFKTWKKDDVEILKVQLFNEYHQLSVDIANILNDEEDKKEIFINTQKKILECAHQVGGDDFVQEIKDHAPVLLNIEELQKEYDKAYNDVFVQEFNENNYDKLSGLLEFMKNIFKTIKPQEGYEIEKHIDIPYIIHKLTFNKLTHKLRVELFEYILNFIKSIQSQNNDELLENIRTEVNTKNDKELCFPTIFIKIMNLLRNLIHDFEMIQQTLKK